MSNIRQNLSVAGRAVILFVLTLASIAISFPQISSGDGDNSWSFSGIEPSMLNSNITIDFQLYPSLEFRDATRLIYRIDGLSNPTEAQLQEITARYELRLRKSGLTDYRITTRTQTNREEYELVVDVPKSADELSGFNQLFNLRGEVSFVTNSTPGVGTSEEEAEANVNFQPTELTKDDIQSVNIVYGAATNGYGYVIDFKDESISKLLLYVVSDISGNQNSGLILQIDGTPVAGQAISYNTLNQDGKITFASGLGNDTLAANLLLQIINSPELSSTLIFDSEQITTIDSPLEDYTDIIKILLATVVFSITVIAIAIFRTYGILFAINLLFTGATSVAILKIFNAPLSVSMIAGLILGISLWAIHSRRSLGLNRHINHTATRANVIQIIKSDRTCFLRFILLSSLILLVLSYSQLPVILHFINSFAVSIFIGWISLYIFPSLRLNLKSIN